MRRNTRRNLRYVGQVISLTLAGITAARLIILMLDTVSARAGNPGGELLIPFYIILLPLIGWQLRGWWDEIKPLFRKEETNCTATPATNAAQRSTPANAVIALRRRSKSQRTNKGLHTVRPKADRII